MNSNGYANIKRKKKILLSKNINNNRNPKNNINNPFNPMKYFYFKEVKKFINIKNNKNNKSLNENEKIKITATKVNYNSKNEEDYYNKIIYEKKINISHNISSIHLINRNLSIKIDKSSQQYYSTDERYKTVNRCGLYTKKIYCEINKSFKRKLYNRNTSLKSTRFSKKSKTKNKIKNIKKYCENININGISNNNVSNYMSSSNNTTSNNKSITNNNVGNYTIFNISNISYFKKTININTNVNNVQKINNCSKGKINKISNIEILKNKKINNIKNTNNKKNQNINNKEDKVFVRRIILEEKYTIDSEGNKKTIFFKKINPIKKVDRPISNPDKKLNKSKKNLKNLNYSLNNENSFKGKNDIKYNFIIDSTPKNKIKNITERKINATNDDDNKYNNSQIANIFQNYRNSLNSYKIVYQNSFGNFSSNKKYFIRLQGKKSDKNHNIKNSPNKYESNKKKSPHLRYIKNNNNYIKNINNKIKTNYSQLNKKKYKKKINNDIYSQDSEDTKTDKKSFSFFKKNSISALVNSVKEKKKKTAIQNESIASEDPINGFERIPMYNKNNFLFFSRSNSSMSSNNNTKKGSPKNYKYLKKVASNNKYNIFININDSNSNCNNYDYFSLNKNRNLPKEKISPEMGNNNNYRNILNKKYRKNKLESDLNKLMINKKNDIRINYSYLIFKKKKDNKKGIKK